MKERKKERNRNVRKKKLVGKHITIKLIFFCRLHCIGYFHFFAWLSRKKEVISVCKYKHWKNEGKKEEPAEK
jgi:flagellar basal body-associated protein FliL